MMEQIHKNKLDTNLAFENFNHVSDPDPQISIEKKRSKAIKFEIFFNPSYLKVVFRTIYLSSLYY